MARVAKAKERLLHLRHSVTREFFYLNRLQPIEKPQFEKINVSKRKNFYFLLFSFICVCLRLFGPLRADGLARPAPSRPPATHQDALATLLGRTQASQTGRGQRGRQRQGRGPRRRARSPATSDATTCARRAAPAPPRPARSRPR